MIKGIGTDILSIKRMADIINDSDSHAFIKKTYTENEIALAKSRANSIMCYSTRFAAKEAVFKALNITEDYINFIEIETLEGEYGKPYVTLHGKAAELAKKKGITCIEISLSYETDYAIAFCIVY